MKKLVRKATRIRKVSRIRAPQHHPNARLLLEAGTGVVVVAVVLAMLGLGPIHIF
jgi:hypothetical protein